MNFEHDEECGAAPGVMGHLACTNRNCSCEPIEECNRKLWAPAEWSQPEREHEVIPPAAMDYLYIAHQTQKATLFAVKDGRQQWVPKSLILSIDEAQNRIIIAGWFARTIL